MDELAKAIKVLRLKDEEYGQYLTASEDQVSVILTTPNSENYHSKNTEWRLQWLKNPKSIDGQIRLWSIYNKALTLAEASGNYWRSNTLTGALTQQPWPPPSDVSEATSEWQFKLRESKNNNGALVADLFRWPEDYIQSVAFTAINPSTNNLLLDKISSYIKSHLKWLNNHSWLVEIVVNDDNDDVVLAPSTMSQKISMTSSNKAINNPDTTLSKSLKQETLLSTPLDEQPIVPSKYSGRSSDVGFLGDRFMIMLPRWQVGQVYFNVSGTSGGFRTSADYQYGLYTNSGGNVNGSGVQKN